MIGGIGEISYEVSEIRPRFGEITPQVGEIPGQVGEINLVTIIKTTNRHKFRTKFYKSAGISSLFVEKF
jgi:hypothetical protein